MVSVRACSKFLLLTHSVSLCRNKWPQLAPSRCPAQAASSCSIHTSLEWTTEGKKMLFSNTEGPLHWHFAVRRTSLDTPVEIFNYRDEKGQRIRRGGGWLGPIFFNKDVIICPPVQEMPPIWSPLNQPHISSVNRQESPHPEYVFVFCSLERLLLQLCWGCLLAALFPNTPDFFLIAAGKLSIKSCHLPPSQDAAPHHVTVSRARCAQLPGQVPGQVSLSVSMEWTEIGNQLAHPQNSLFLRSRGRTCVYWQFINKHQPPCKLFTKECSEVKKCEYK